MNQNRNNSEKAFFSRWIRQISYANKNVIEHIKSYFLSYFITCFAISVTIVLPAATYVLWKNSYVATKEWQPSPNLTIYLSQSTKDVEKDNLLKELKKNESIQDATYMSKDETLSEFTKWSGFKHSFELLDSNPLPAVIILEPNKSQYDKDALLQLSENLRSYSIIDEVKFDDSWVTRLVALSNLIKWLALTLSILMLFALFLVIANNIRFSIFVRHHTIKVMQLLGATDNFILRPFLYYGLMIGALSGLLSILFTQLIVFQFEKIMNNISFVFDMNFSLEGLSFFESAILFLAITILSWFSAYFTTKRYLNTENFRSIGV